MVITRSTPSCSRRVSVGEPEVVTTNCPGARPDAAWAERAVSSKRGRLGPAGALMPSPRRPASSAIFGPKPPTITGTGGSGRRKPRAPPAAPVHTWRSVPTAASTARRRPRSPATGRPSATCSAAYGVPRPPPAPIPRSRRPPLTSCSVAAMTAKVPGSRLATLSTSEPSMTLGTAAASALRIVQHSSTWGSPWTEPARWSYSQTPSKPAASAARVASRRSSQRPPKGSNRRSTSTGRRYPPPRGRSELGDQRSHVDLVELRGVVLQDLALNVGRELGHRGADPLHAVGVQAGRVGDVGLEHDAVRAELVDGGQQRAALEPEAPVELAAEVLRGLHRQVGQVLGCCLAA